MTVDTRTQAPDPRALELINKTNQFNLNGRRLHPAEWERYLDRPGVFLWLVSYEDRFGPLGKIAALAGTRDGQGVNVDHWVMSCRAFSRRIEHACLRHLYQTFGVSQVRMAYSATERNGPLKEFLMHFSETPTSDSLTIEKEEFERASPPVHIRISELGDG